MKKSRNGIAMKPDKILTSGIEFSEEESLQKYRFTLVNAMFISGSAVALIAALLRFATGSTAIAAIDATLALFFFSSLLYLRTNRNAIGLLTTLLLVVSYLAFSALVVMLEENTTKLLWYTVFISAAFMTQGVRTGLIAYSAVVITLTLLYILPELYPQTFTHLYLQLSLTEIVMALIFYSIVTLYALFATFEQQISFDNLREANRATRAEKQKLFAQMRTFPLTGLPNSLALNEKIATRDHDPLALVTLVIDDFINLADEFGSDIAHKIVTQSADVLKRFTTERISLYQVAPYQFSFLLEKSNATDACSFAESIKNYFDKVDLAIDANLEISVSFSMGIATGAHETLITHANTAMHQTLQNGVNNYKLFTFDPRREKERKNNIYWNRKIKEIINHHRLRLFYQPIVDNRSGEISKYECLIRALDKDQIISPYAFLQAAKTRGMLPTITRFVIEESFSCFSRHSVSFTINITEEDLRLNYLPGYLSHMSKRYGITPSRVYLEILESLTADQSAETIAQFDLLKQMGFQLAIDDFGAESSNLSRLLTYDADIIKIDGQFIKHLDTDPNSVKIVETIVSLTHKLGAKTVAEFVHSKEIYAIVKALGVDYSQGYYLGEPQPEITSLPQYETV